MTRQQNYLMSNNKVILCSDIIENYSFEKPYFYNSAPLPRDTSQGKNTTTCDRQKKLNLARTRDLLRRLINSNIKKNIQSQFLTLTYQINQTNRNQSLNDYRKFIRNINNHLNTNLKYITVIEKQKRGAIHFHSLILNSTLTDTHEKNTISNNKYIDGHKRPTSISTHIADNKINSNVSVNEIYALLKYYWPHGFYKLHSVKKINNIGAYLSKYLSKSFTREKNTKRYLCSRGLCHPIVIHNRQLDTIYDKSTLQTVVSREYYSKKYGVVRFNQYKKL